MPILLGQRQIGWHWAATDIPGELGYATAIQRSDFVIAVLDGSRSDHRVLYEVGVAEGMGKPIFVVSIRKRTNAFAISKFAVATVGLHEAGALGFQLDLFLSTPHESIFIKGTQLPPSPQVAPVVTSEGPVAMKGEALERFVFDEIVLAGGTAIAEPGNNADIASADLVMWLPMQEPVLLDPAMIEVKAKATAQVARTVERNLLPLIQAGGMGSALLLTQERPASAFRPTAPHFFWLSIDQFVELIRAGQLGRHLRELRNRAAHGMP